MKLDEERLKPFGVVSLSERESSRNDSLTKKRPRGVHFVYFWVRGRAIGKGIDFPDIGIKNGINFHNFVTRNGTDFQDFFMKCKIRYTFSKN